MTKNEAIQAVKILRTLTEISEASTILSTFVNVFLEKGVTDEHGQMLLHGNFNLGGTVSGRLSSSNPNLQNLPSNEGKPYSKLVKKCFEILTKDWIMVGADFNGLEDRISALTTRDPNKLRVFTEGIDGHCYKAYYYYKHLMPDIVDTVASINSVKTKYSNLRQQSKPVTFALTYAGTWHTLVNNLGLPKKDAKRIENNFHELYKVSVDWVKDKLVKASKTGYVECAFGLKLRTPILKQTIMNTSYTPFEAQKEARTAGNALGQSWGLLNNRAAIEFQERIFNSKHIYDIKPIAQIHDAMYFMVRKDTAVVKWVNDNLIECMEWQNHPLIYHPNVKLGGVLSIFYPDWSVDTPVPNKASEAEINTILNTLK